jgi:PAS domain S-box-containing protein
MVDLLELDTAATIESELETLKLIIEHIGEGMAVVNTDGVITHFNKAYGKFLDIDPEAQIGRHITEVVENTRLHIVARTGRAEINESQSIKGQNMIVQRIPIRKDGQVVGAFGQVIFKDSKEVGQLAKKLSELESRVRIYQKDLDSLRTAKYSLDSIVGDSAAIKGAKREALKAARTNLSVLITGESGTGKELFAQSIHNASDRKLFPMIRLNCAAIPGELLESELFGYEKGAFTGAKNTGKKGKFELADKGTLFLDEIGDLPLDMQPKLLRVLEEKEFERLGGNRVLRSDFRLIAASNQDLDVKIKERAFRTDLFYRLNVMHVHIPPLRERSEDISMIAAHLIKKITEETRQQELSLTYGAEQLLLRHSWPGNVRELNNVIERTVATCEGDQITPADLPFYLHKSSADPAVIQRSLLKEVVAKAEKAAILDALKMTGYNKKSAASLLGIHRTLLYKKIKKYRISLSPE